MNIFPTLPNCATRTAAFQRAGRRLLLLTVGVALCCLVSCATSPSTTTTTAADHDLIIDVPRDARTIAEAMRRATAGTLIRLAPGTYHESVALKNGVTLQGAGVDNTVLTSDRSDEPVLHATDVQDCLVENCVLRYAGQADNYVVRVIDAQLLLRNCIVTGGTLSGAVVKGQRAYLSLERVLLHDNAESGVLFTSGANGQVSQCTSWHNGRAGISVASGRPGILFNTVVDNQGPGIWIRNHSQPLVQGNIVVGNRWGITAVPGALQEEPGQPRLRQNLCWDNTKGDLVDVRHSTAYKNTDPLFVDRRHGDFTLNPDTPALLPNGAVLGAWPVSRPGSSDGTGRMLVVPDDFSAIQTALDNAAAGDTVLVRAGVYNENLTLPNGVHLQGEGRDQVVVQSAANNADAPVLLASECAVGSVRELTFLFRSKSANYVAWVIDSSITVERCAFLRGSLSGVEIRGELSEPIFRECLIQENTENGLVFLNQAGGVVERCDISNNGLNGVTVLGQADPDLLYNTVVDNEQAGLWVRDGSQPLLEGNSVVGNQWGISVDSGEAGATNGAPRLARNLAWDNPGGNFYLIRPSATGQEADPVFRHRAGGDYRIAPDSPANRTDGAVLGAYPVDTTPDTWHVPGMVRTIQQAIDIAWPGDEIVVAPGTYQETLTLKSGIRLRAETEGETRVEGGTQTRPVLTAQACNDSELEGFTFRYIGGGEAYGVEIIRSTIALRDCSIIGATLTGVLVRDANPSLIGLTVRDNAQSGVHFTENSTGLLQSSTIAGNRLNGVSVDMASTPTIAYNTIVDNMGVGIWVRDSARPVLEYNIVAYNSWGISADSGEDPAVHANGDPQLRGNCLWENVTLNFEQVQQSTSDIVANPQFVNKATGNFRLQPGSPAILDSGTPRGAWPIAR